MDAGEAKRSGADWTEYSGGSVSWLPSAGGRIVARSWRPSAPVRALACLHGLGARSQEFVPLGEYLSRRRTAVYALDFAGCGDSEGPRGVVRPSVYRANVGALLGAVGREHPGLPIVLLGHSLGALIALWYAARQPQGLAGLVLAAPPLRPGRRPRAGLVLRTALARLLALDLRVPLGLETDDGTPSARYLRSAPWRVHAWTPRSYWALARWFVGARRAARQLRLPALIVQGEADTLALPGGSRRLLSWLGSPDKRLALLPGAGHSFWDALGPIESGRYSAAQREQFLALIAGWLEAR